MGAMGGRELSPELLPHTVTVACPNTSPLPRNNLKLQVCQMQLLEGSFEKLPPPAPAAWGLRLVLEEPPRSRTSLPPGIGFSLAEGVLKRRDPPMASCTTLTLPFRAPPPPVGTAAAKRPMLLCLSPQLPGGAAPPFPGCAHCRSMEAHALLLTQAAWPVIPLQGSSFPLLAAALSWKPSGPSASAGSASLNLCGRASWASDHPQKQLLVHTRDFPVKAGRPSQAGGGLWPTPLDSLPLQMPWKPTGSSFLQAF